jgi:hypothetical protein
MAWMGVRHSMFFRAVLPALAYADRSLPLTAVLAAINGGPRDGPPVAWGFHARLVTTERFRDICPDCTIGRLFPRRLSPERDASRWSVAGPLTCGDIASPYPLGYHPDDVQAWRFLLWRSDGFRFGCVICRATEDTPGGPVFTCELLEALGSCHTPCFEFLPDVIDDCPPNGSGSKFRPVKRPGQYCSRTGRRRRGVSLSRRVVPVGRCKLGERFTRVPLMQRIMRS